MSNGYDYSIRELILESTRLLKNHDYFSPSLQDDSLKERLLDLTLPRAVSIVQHSESSKKHVKEMSIVMKGTTIRASGRGRVFFPVGNVAEPTSLRSIQQANNALSATGLIILPRCAEASISCRNPQLYTKKKIHVLMIDVNSDSESTLSLDPIQVDDLAEQSWFSTISTSSGDVNFKLDTGTDKCDDTHQSL